MAYVPPSLRNRLQVTAPPPSSRTFESRQQPVKSVDVDKKSTNCTVLYLDSSERWMVDLLKKHNGNYRTFVEQLKTLMMTLSELSVQESELRKSIAKIELDCGKKFIGDIEEMCNYINVHKCKKDALGLVFRIEKYIYDIGNVEQSVNELNRKVKTLKSPIDMLYCYTKYGGMIRPCMPYKEWNIEEDNAAYQIYGEQLSSKKSFESKLADFDKTKCSFNKKEEGEIEIYTYVSKIMEKINFVLTVGKTISENDHSLSVTRKNNEKSLKMVKHIRKDSSEEEDGVYDGLGEEEDYYRRKLGKD